MTEPTLTASALSVAYAVPGARGFNLRRMSFELHAGCTLGVIGESGSGKTTLVNALLGVLPRNAAVSAGQLCFEGRDLIPGGEAAFAELRGSALAAVFQEVDAAADPRRSLGSALVALCRRREPDPAEAQADASQLLGRLGVSEPAECLRALPHELPLGVRQRLLLAMALASEPQVLVLDCPTSYLDGLSQRRVLDELRQFQAELNLALVLVSNDIDVIAALAHEVLVLHAGEIVEHGATGQVLTRPAHPYTQALLASWQEPNRVRIPLLSVSRTPSADDHDACLFLTRCTRRLGLPEAERCKQQTPELELTPGGSRVRCFFPREP